jgi:hypothetical protein
MHSFLELQHVKLYIYIHTHTHTHNHRQTRKTCKWSTRVEESNFFRQQMHSLLKYKMLQLTFKISLCGLLHVSVRSDHHQGAYAEPC